MIETIASVLSLTALMVVGAFVILYAVRSPWREGLVSRALMYVMASLGLVMTFVFVRRWLGLPDGVLDIIAVGVYAVLVLMLVWLLVALLYGQSGRITAEKPNYTPIRDWIHRRRTKKES